MLVLLAGMLLGGAMVAVIAISRLRNLAVIATGVLLLLLAGGMIATAPGSQILRLTLPLLRAPESSAWAVMCLLTGVAACGGAALGWGIRTLVASAPVEPANPDSSNPVMSAAARPAANPDSLNPAVMSAAARPAANPDSPNPAVMSAAARPAADPDPTDPAVISAAARAKWLFEAGAVLGACLILALASSAFGQIGLPRALLLALFVAGTIVSVVELREAMLIEGPPEFRSNWGGLGGGLGGWELSRSAVLLLVALAFAAAALVAAVGQSPAPRMGQLVGAQQRPDHGPEAPKPVGDR